MTKNRALGRGLGALLGNTEVELQSQSVSSDEPVVGSIGKIAIAKIETNPFQPRSRFDQEKLDELAASILSGPNENEHVTGGAVCPR